MKSHAYRSEPERSYVSTVTVSDLDLANQRNAELLIQEVRIQLASRIADLIMQRLAPAISEALAQENDRG